MKKANVCKKCGKVFLGNKCPECGTEVLPETPESRKGEKSGKEVREFRY